MSFETMWDDLGPVGRAPTTGGYQRFAWTREDSTLRQWFTGEAASRGLDVVTDRAGNLWAWWGNPDAGIPGVVLGSHLDSVPDGGAFDGPLGVVSAFAALDHLRAGDFRPAVPVGIACFSDEEGARFGIACAGSRLITGILDADRARALRDGDGITLAEAMARSGHDPGQVGPDPETLRRIGMFVELHVEQGRGLADLGRPVAVGSSIWPHGRWRLDLEGEANHAGTTRLADRHDPMLDLAHVVTTARTSAGVLGCVATVGKIQVIPNGVNAIPSRVTAWLDARGPVEDDVRSVVRAVGTAAA
ncbi:MAG: allantoate amidohydrolase, partial [Frankia sp.]